MFGSFQGWSNAEVCSQIAAQPRVDQAPDTHSKADLLGDSVVIRGFFLPMNHFIHIISRYIPCGVCAWFSSATSTTSKQRLTDSRSSRIHTGGDAREK